MGKELVLGPGISDRHRAFLHQYIKHWDGTKAAAAVGYKNPSVTAANILKRPNVKKALEKLQKREEEEVLLDRQAIMEELSRLSMRDVIEMTDDGGYITNDLNQIPPYIRRCIDGIKIRNDYDKDGEVIRQQIEFKLVAKLQAFDMLNKMQGNYAPEQVEVKETKEIDWDKEFEREERRTDGEIIDGIVEKRVENQSGKKD